MSGSDAVPNSWRIIGRMHPMHVPVGEDRRFFAAAIARRGEPGHLVLLTLNFEDTRLSPMRIDLGYISQYRRSNRSSHHYVRFPVSGRVVELTKFAKQELYGNAETWFAPLPAADARTVFAEPNAVWNEIRRATKPPWAAYRLPCPLRVKLLDGRLAAHGSVDVCLDASLSSPPKPAVARYDIAMCVSPPTPALLPRLAESIAYHTRHGVQQFVVHAPLNTRAELLEVLEPFIDRGLVSVVLADFEQNLDRARTGDPTAGDPRLWPYLTRWGHGFPSVHGQHLLKTDCALRLAGVARFFKMQARRGRAEPRAWAWCEGGVQ